jgi:hypothetical protein
MPHLVLSHGRRWARQRSGSCQTIRCGGWRSRPLLRTPDGDQVARSPPDALLPCAPVGSIMNRSIMNPAQNRRRRKAALPSAAQRNRFARLPRATTGYALLETRGFFAFDVTTDDTRLAGSGHRVGTDWALN